MKIFIPDVSGASVMKVDAEEKPNSYRVISGTKQAVFGTSQYVGTFYKKNDVFLDLESALHFINAELLGRILDLEGQIEKNTGN